MDMNTDELVPMRSVYERNGITADVVAKVRKEALEAKIERPLKVSGVSMSPLEVTYTFPDPNADQPPDNLVRALSTSEETVYLHRTVDHRTRLQAAEAVVEEMGLKPSKKIDVNMAASGILAEVLKDIDGVTLGIPSKRKE